MIKFHVRNLVQTYIFIFIITFDIILIRKSTWGGDCFKIEYNLLRFFSICYYDILKVVNKGVLICL